MNKDIRNWQFKKIFNYIYIIAIIILFYSILISATDDTRADIQIPLPVTNLKNNSYADNYINWTWIDPNNIDPKFLEVMVYIDWLYKGDASGGVQYYNATGLDPNTSHYIYTITYDRRNNRTDGLITGDIERTAQTTSMIPTTLTPTIADATQINSEINWSGYKWKVMDYFATPGPCQYSNSSDNVWTDGQGNLHLEITYRNETWYCSQIDSKSPMGFGTYTWTIINNPYNWDLNVDGGAFYFLGPNDATGNWNELDAEISRWGDSSVIDQHIQYSVWNGKASSSNYLPTTPGGFNYANTTHKMVWYSNGQVDFEASDSLGNLISSWSYPGPYLTKTGGPFIFDIWLLNGKPPSNGLEQELIISNFTYTPSFESCRCDSSQMAKN
jgi:hypothetical protein